MDREVCEHGTPKQLRCAECNENFLRSVIDVLALALASHHHYWTDEERRLYEQVHKSA